MSTEPARPILPPYTPEMLPAAVELMACYLRNVRGGADVMELGSGASTAWFLRRSSWVVSLEHDLGWYAEVGKTIPADSAPRLSRLLVHPVQGFLQVMDWLGSSRRMDLVLVDCVDEARVSAAMTAKHVVRPGGVVVVDDSHWSMFEGLDSHFPDSGWDRYVVSGDHTRRTGEVRFHQTTFYERKV